MSGDGDGPPRGRPGPRAALALLWALHWLPLPLLAALGRALGAALHALARSRRRVARRNVALCFPAMPSRERDALVREHFGWLARSVLERGVLWHASPARLRRLVQVDGDIAFAERDGGAAMWLVPHFVGLEAIAPAGGLFQTRAGASIYQTQSDPAFDAAMRRGRQRFGDVVLFSRAQSARALLRAVRDGRVLLTFPDMDFGARDAAFVPFFGVPAATLLAPARLARTFGMRVQPVAIETLPRGRGWRVRFEAPWTDFPGDAGDEAAMRRLNAWIEDEVRRVPAQYLWVHRRFKTTPPGAVDRYAGPSGPHGAAPDNPRGRP